MLSYAKSFLGIPYRWWNPMVSCCENTGPFWACEGPEVPLEEVQKGHMCCAGLLNLVCRKFGLEIPGAKDLHIYAGGTGLWWDFFEETDRLQPFDPSVSYPKATLLLRKYKSEEDQGHIAICMGEDLILHSWPEKGVVLEPRDPNYYEAVVLEFLHEN